MVLFCRKCFLILEPAEESVASDSALALNSDSSNPQILNSSSLATHECPQCKSELLPEPLLPWMKGICAAQKIPWTDERRIKCSIGQSNADYQRSGPKTARTKFISSANAIKHGAHARVHLWPKAKHGTYKACNDCPFASAKTNPAGNGRCESEKWLLCEHQLPVFVSFANAHLGEGHKAIQFIIGDSQALAALNLHRALSEIMMEGPTIEQTIFGTEQVYDPVTKTRTTQKVEIGTRRQANPALKAVEVTGNMLGINLPQWNMTPKSAVESDKDNELASLFSRFMSAQLPPPQLTPAESGS